MDDDDATGSRTSPLPPSDEVTLDARNLRGIAHPVRVRLLGFLRFDGPSTATRLAQRLGLNSGATSYHLRQLERHGFIAEDEARGRGKERWWRAAHRLTRFDDAVAAGDDETAELAESYLRSVVAVHADLAQRAIDEGSSLPDRWCRASAFNDVEISLTADEVERLKQELLEVIARYDDRSQPAEDDSAASGAGRAPVMVQLHVFPRPGALIPEAES